MSIDSSPHFQDSPEWKSGDHATRVKAVMDSDHARAFAARVPLPDDESARRIASVLRRARGRR